MSTETPPMKTSLDLMRWVGWAQMRAFQEWISARGITPEQGFVLGYLNDHPGAIQRDIAKVSRTTPASVTSLLQGLERRELISREQDSENARSKRVYITPAGAELIRGFDEATAQMSEDILSALTAAERDQLHSLMLKLTAQLPTPTRD